MRHLEKLFIGLITTVVVSATQAMASPSLSSSSGSGDSEITESISGTQYFPRSVSTIKNISSDLRNLAHSVDSLYRIRQIDSLLISGNSSPDGPGIFNRNLALDRAKSVHNYIDFATSIPDSLMRVSSHACNWTDLNILLTSRDWSRPSSASEAIRIINNGGKNMVANLRSANKGELWKWLDAEVFPLMRATSVIAFYETDPINLTPEIPMYEVIEPEPDCELIENINYEEIIPADDVVDDYPWRRYLYVKTNLPAWLCLWLNAAVEIDLTPHISATLPIYYSGFNYFSRTLKFRTFAIQPELRFWPQKDNHGFFVGAHFGLAYYNLALNGENRYQDHDGKTPALGGGVAIGWRFRINSNPNLTMEATIGGGIYCLDYDIFHNWTNGLLTGRKKRTFYGVDQAALSITYRFGLRKRKVETSAEKGGDR